MFTVKQNSVHQVKTFKLPSITQRSWKPIAWISTCYLLSIILAGLLAPWLFKATLIWNQMSPNAFNTYLLKKGMPVYVDRLRWAGLVIGLLWIFRKTGLWGKEALHLKNQDNNFYNCLACFFFGIGLIGFVGTTQFFLKIVDWKTHIDWQSFGFIAAKAFIGAWILAFLEEVVFRGLIFRSFVTAYQKITPAIWISGFIFAYLHFKAPKSTNIYDSSMLTGLHIAWQTLIGPFYTGEWLPFLNLWALGGMLATLYTRVVTLWPIISLHAGIAFLLLLYKHAVETQGLSPAFLGSNRLIDGGLSLVIIGLLTIWFSCWPSFQPEQADDPKDKPE